jgi:hypothetical protein
MGMIKESAATGRERRVVQPVERQGVDVYWFTLKGGCGKPWGSVGRESPTW